MILEESSKYGRISARLFLTVGVLSFLGLWVGGHGFLLSFFLGWLGAVLAVMFLGLAIFAVVTVRSLWRGEPNVFRHGPQQPKHEITSEQREMMEEELARAFQLQQRKRDIYEEIVRDERARRNVKNQEK